MFREADKEDYLTIDIEEKRMSLYFLYLYHVNYDDEPQQNKRVIREYYDRELRYIGSFYKDAKVFRERGNPLDWEAEKVKRYKVKEGENVYFNGMNAYQNFVYPSTTLIEIELSKKIELSLLERGQKKLILNLNYDIELLSILEEMKKIMNMLDNTDNLIRIQKGWDKPKPYDLSDLQITFKIQTNDHIRWISTPFMTPFFVIDKALNMIENYLANLTRLEAESLGEEFISKYIEYDEDFYVNSCVLEKIELKKRTNAYNTLTKRKEIRGYELEIRNLSSINIKELPQVYV